MVQTILWLSLKLTTNKLTKKKIDVQDKNNMPQIIWSVGIKIAVFRLKVKMLIDRGIILRV